MTRPARYIGPISPRCLSDSYSTLDQNQIDNLAYYLATDQDKFEELMVSYLDKFDNGRLYPDKYGLDNIARAIYKYKNFRGAQQSEDTLSYMLYKYIEHRPIYRLQTSLRSILDKYPRLQGYFVMDIFDSIIETILFYYILDIADNSDIITFGEHVHDIIRYDNDNRLIYDLLNRIYTSSSSNKLDTMSSIVMTLFDKTNINTQDIMNLLYQITYPNIDSYNYIYTLLMTKYFRL